MLLEDKGMGYGAQEGSLLIHESLPHKSLISHWQREWSLWKFHFETEYFMLV